MWWICCYCCKRPEASNEEVETEKIFIYTENRSKSDSETVTKGPVSDIKAGFEPEFVIPKSLSTHHLFSMQKFNMSHSLAPLDATLYPEEDLKAQQQFKSSSRSDSFSGQGSSNLIFTGTKKFNTLNSTALDTVREYSALPIHKKQERQRSTSDSAGESGEQVDIRRYSDASTLVATPTDGLLNEDYVFMDKGRLKQSFDERTFGNISFSLQYHLNCKLLNLTINKLVGMPCKGLQGSSYSSMVKVQMVPSSDNITAKTKFSKVSLNPKFNQSFVFVIDLKKKKWQNRILQFSIYERGRQEPEDAIGHAVVKLQSIDFTSNDLCIYNLPIKQEPQPNVKCGKILLQLEYDSIKESLKIFVEKAKDLQIKHDKIGGSLKKSRNYVESTYIKVTFRNSGETIKTVRSPVVKGGLEVQYDQSFSFVVPLAYLNDSSIVCSVMQQNILKPMDTLVGRVVEGPFLFSQNNDITLWGLMIRTRSSVSSWRKLHQ